MLAEGRSVDPQGGSVSSALSDGLWPLTRGFGLTTALWAVALILRWPHLRLAPELAGAAMTIVTIAAAAFWGRTGPRRAVMAVAVSAAANLLLMGAVVRGPTGGLGFAWLPTSFLITVGTGAFAATVGGRWPLRPAVLSQRELFQHGIGGVLATSFLLISFGALTTTAEAGLAVPDWPHSYGHLMFLFPAEAMVGGIFYEHGHRLLGSLVGLQTLVLTVYAHSRPSMKWARSAMRLSLALVVLQGLLGGLRVVLVNLLGSGVALHLAAMHALTAQIFLISLVSAWHVADSTESRPRLLLWPIVLVLGQTILGAVLRHQGLSVLVVAHIAGAFVVGAACVWLARRARRRSLVWLWGAQLALGAGTFLVVRFVGRIEQTTQPGWLLITCAHVVLGAALTAKVADAVLALPGPAATESSPADLAASFS